MVTTGPLMASFKAEGFTQRGLRALHGLTALLLERGWLLILAWVPIASALLLTPSHGGFFAGSAGLCVLLAAFLLRRGSRPGLAMGAAAPILVGGIGLCSLGGEATNARMEGDAAERGCLYALILQAVAARPLTGWDHGSFADVFRMVRDAKVPQDIVKAHNS